MIPSETISSKTKTKLFRWPVTMVFGISLAAISVGLALKGDIVNLQWLYLSLPLLLLLLWSNLAKRGRGFYASLIQYCHLHTDRLDSMDKKYLMAWIALASGLGLFIELMIIRWHASALQIFGYFKNVSLMAAFLGLGIGYALGGRRPVYTPFVIPALSLQFILLHLLRLSKFIMLRNPVSEELSFLMGLSSFGHVLVTYGFLILVFAVTVLTCIPLGHLASRLMKGCQPLIAYSWNLVGSLAGILLFVFLSYIWAPPAVWFILACTGVVLFLLIPPRKSVVILSLASIALTITVLDIPHSITSRDIFSPYQILSLQVDRNKSVTVNVNHVFYQKMFDLKKKVPPPNKNLTYEDYRQFPEIAKLTYFYNLPYYLLPRPGKVLIVGSGTGNDVAAALRNWSDKIDAVEIDPVILKIGKELHPESPYQSMNVTSFNVDARRFIRYSKEKYDLIVYGLLDSHTLLSSMSNVRLDSFVYTLEAFQEARQRLSKDGLICLSFTLISHYQGKKFYLMLREAFQGKEPRVFLTPLTGATLFVAGPALGKIKSLEGLPVQEITSMFRRDPTVVDYSTDDWPFTYMITRKYPYSYLIMIAVLLVVSWLILYQILPRRGEKDLKEPFSWVCFFLGAGFMLIETKGITELALNFGSNWQVVTVVIIGILFMAFLANLCIIRFGTPNSYLIYGLLLGSLVVGMNISVNSWDLNSPMVAGILAALFVTIPILFSGFAFSSEIFKTGDISSALSANLLGAMMGGFLEYNSLYFGFSGLYIFALVIYGLAFFSTLWGRKRQRIAREPDH